MSKNELTLGSLFDGSGGFPLGGLMCGIKPIWASEIEPFAIRVTTKRLPFMKHLVDINAVNGSQIDPVDIITFGSPCQDVSIAGKREGLDGKRSICGNMITLQAAYTRYDIFAVSHLGFYRPEWICQCGTAKHD